MVEVDRVVDASGPQGVALQVQRLGSRRSSRRGRSRSACVANEGLRHRRGSGPPRFAGRSQVARCRRRERPPPIRESAPRGLEDVRLDAAAGGGRGGSVSVPRTCEELGRGGRRQRRRRRRDRGARAARTSSSTATVSPRDPSADRLVRDGCSGTTFRDGWRGDRVQRAVRPALCLQVIAARAGPRHRQERGGPAAAGGLGRRTRLTGGRVRRLAQPAAPPPPPPARPLAQAALASGTDAGKRGQQVRGGWSVMADAPSAPSAAGRRGRPRGSHPDQPDPRARTSRRSSGRPGQPGRFRPDAVRSVIVLAVPRHFI